MGKGSGGVLGGVAGEVVGGDFFRGAGAFEVEAEDAAGIDFEDGDVVVFDGEGVAGFGETAHFGGDVAADGGDLVGVEFEV